MLNLKNHIETKVKEKVKKNFMIFQEKGKTVKSKLGMTITLSLPINVKKKGNLIMAKRKSKSSFKGKSVSSYFGKSKKAGVQLERKKVL
ncbi:MAG: hypothetical protein KAI50_03930 [Desulfobacterales bacterium]|nr:hypothetical protein [Desulfobacterales bacterium]